MKYQMRCPKCDHEWATDDRLAELAKADKEGRCEVLPYD